MTDSDDARDLLRVWADEIGARRAGDRDIAQLLKYLATALEWELAASRALEANGRMVREMSAYVPAKVQRRLLAREMARF